KACIRGQALAFGRHYVGAEVDDGQQAWPTLVAPTDLNEQDFLGVSLQEFDHEGLLGRNDRWRRRRRRHEDLHALDKGGAPGRYFQRLQVALAVQDAVRQRLLVPDQMQNVVFDASLGDQVDDRDGAKLVLAPCATNALFKAGRIPRQIEVDHRVCNLQVQSDT